MQENKAHEQHTQQDWGSYANMPVGEILRRTRMHYDLSLQDVERALHIRSMQLNAIEEGNLANLPGRVYAIGFVRTYAEFLGLDGDKIVQLFKSQIAGHTPKPELYMPAPTAENKLPNKYILAAAFCGLVVFSVIIAVMTPNKETQEVPLPEPTQTASVSPELLYGPPRPDDIQAILMLTEPAAGDATIATDEPRIEIGAIENAWVEIRDEEGKALVSQILKPGDTYFVPNQEGLVMDTGNIGALEFTLDGVKLNPLGEMGDVRRKMELSPQALLGTPEEDAIEPLENNTAAE